MLGLPPIDFWNVHNQQGNRAIEEIRGYKVLRDLSIAKRRLLYIYADNQAHSWKRFFDNLSVEMFSGPMVEESHYYPFGLTMAGISDKALKSQYTQNKYRYSGKELQNQEFSDGTGLEEYDYGARFYDPQIGRWMMPDPSAEKYYGISPYAYVDNNPINNRDGDGKDIIVTRLHKQYSNNEVAKNVLRSPTDVLRFPPKSVHDLGVTGFEGGVTYSKNKKTGKYDVHATVVEFVNEELRPGASLDQKNPGLLQEVSAHEEGHGDQDQEALNSSISIGSGIALTKGDKTTEIKFSGKIDEVLDQASSTYDKVKSGNPSFFGNMSKEDYVKNTFNSALHAILESMVKDKEDDANKRASKKLNGNMPYTNGQKQINL